MANKLRFIAAIIEGDGIKVPFTNFDIFTYHDNEFQATRSARLGHVEFIRPGLDAHRALVAAVAPRRLVDAYWDERMKAWDLVLEEMEVSK